MKRTKKMIAMGLALGMVLNSLPVSAAEVVTANEQNENSEWISEQQEDVDTVNPVENPAQEEELEDDEWISVQEETECEGWEGAPVQPEETDTEDTKEISTQSDRKAGENITYELTSDGVLTLSGSGPMFTFDYDWKEYKPTCGWADYISNIKKVVIGEGITSISQYSFYDCENLTEVSIPASVTSIGQEAFHWCPNINKVMIDGLQSWCQINFEDENSNPLKFGADLYINGIKTTRLTIPDGITEIKPYAFGRSWTNDDSKTAVTSIQLPDSVVSIGENAFAYNHLQSINIPDSVVKVGNEAFAGNYFSTIKISENIEIIGSAAFKDCKELQKIKIPDTAKKIGGGIFSGCSKLAGVELPQGIDTITQSMFAGCKSLMGFKVPDTVQVIEDSAFSGCNNLAAIELPDQIYKIGDLAFYNCSSLSKIELPTELDCIGDWTFCGCAALSEITIPDKVVSIGKQAFKQCTSLSKITIPDAVTSMGESAFYECGMLENFKVPEGVKEIQKYTFYGCTKLESVTLCPNVTSIGEYAFQNCADLKGITIPDQVAEIGKQAFAGCENIESIVLPSLVSKIADSTFSACKSLKTVQLSENVVVIEAGAFANCSNLSEITIPEKVIEIGNMAFGYCTVLRRIDFKGNAPRIGVTTFSGVTAECYYPADNASYTLEIITQDFGGDLTWTYEGKEEENKYKCGENLIWNLTENGKLVITGSGRMFDYSVADYQYAPWYEDRKTIVSIELDNNITYIGNYAFYACNKVTDENIVLPEKLEEIGEGAFKNCSIKSVDIPSMVTNVGKEAFAGSGLNQVSLPSNLQSLSERMFADSHNLRKVIFSEGLREIGNSAFYCCFELNSVVIPEGVTSIGNQAFGWCGPYKTYGAYYSCRNFKEVTLPSTLTTIGSSAFVCCHALQSINIPKNITEIKDSTFRNCYELSSIIIPAGIKKIENGVFFDNRSLKTVTFSWNAPEIASKAFDGGSLQNVKATCYYPSNNPAWTSSMLQNYGGKLTWVAKEMTKPAEGAGAGGSGSGGTGTGTGDNNSGSDSGTGSGSGSGGSGSGDTSGGNTSGGNTSGGNTSGGNTSGGNTSGGNTSGGNTSGGSGSGGSSSGGTGTGESGNTGGSDTEKTLGFTAHSLTLNGDIGVNFYLELDEEILNDPDAVMEIEVAGSRKTTIKVSDAVANGSEEVKDTEGNSHQCYKFTCNVYAKQMADNIVATLKTSSGTWKEIYSVQNYADKAQNSSNEKLKNLVNAMVVYGGYAQMLLGYNTGNLVGGSPGDLSSVTKDRLAEYAYAQDGEEANLSVYGSSLLLKGQTTIRMYYQLAEGNITDYRFTIDGKEVQPVQSGTGNIYYVEVNDIAAQDLERAHVFTAGNITVSNYSALSYVNKALDSEKSSENNKKAAAALYLYWNAAEAYFS